MVHRHILLGLALACAWPATAIAQDLPDIDLPDIGDVDDVVEDVVEEVEKAVEEVRETAEEEVLSQSAAIRAVRENRALPLNQLLVMAAPAISGQIIDVQLVTRGGVLVYEVKVLAPRGRVSTLLFDASTGAQLATGQP